MFVKDILSSENNNQLTKNYYLLINYINEITELQFVLQNFLNYSKSQLWTTREFHKMIFEIYYY